MENRIGKRILSGLLSAVIATTATFTAMPATTFAATAQAEWDGSVSTVFAGGVGTEAKPFLIANGAQLALLWKELADKNTQFEGVYFKLMNDIVLNDGVEEADEPLVWNPIGYEGYGFKGTLDGNGYSIIGLYHGETTARLFGVFGMIEPEGAVKNLNMKESTLNGSCPSYNTHFDYVGNIAGYSHGTISNCNNYNPIEVSVTGSWSGADYIGGICGVNDGTLKDCNNYATISLNGPGTYLGGVAGLVTGGSATINCNNYVDIAGDNSVGGICGVASGGSVVEDCSNYGKKVTGGTNTGGVAGYIEDADITNCHNVAAVQGYNATGGVVGEANRHTDIVNCTNNGSVSGNKCVGGVVGYAGDGYTYITDCTNTGAVSCIDKDVGGIAGHTVTSDFVGCINTGNVTGGNNASTGGVFGYKYNCLAERCYNTGNVIGNATCNGGIVGYAEGGTYINCANLGNVTSEFDYNGGLTGYFKNAVVFENCYNTGDITGASYTCGLWGILDNTTNGSATNCYNAGSVTGTGSNVYPVGETATNIENVYYDCDVCDLSYYANMAFAKTTEEMTAPTVIADLGFNAAEWTKKTDSYWYSYYPDLSALDNDLPCILKGAPVPQNVEVYAGNGKAMVKWDPVIGASKYAVYLYNNGAYTCKSSAVTGTSFAVTGLANGVKYGFKIKAYVNGAWKEATSLIYATPTFTGVPRNIKTIASDNKVTMTWDKVTGATKYAVYIYDNGAYVCKSNAVTGTSYAFTGLKNNVKYGFKVKAYVNGAWKNASAIVYGTPLTVGIPQNVKTTAGNNKVTMTWDAVTGASQYAVYVLQNGSYVCKNNAVTGTSYTFTGLTNGTAYSFKVKALVNGVWKAASAAVSGTPTNAGIPQNLKTTAGDGKVTMTWGAVSGATKYAVYMLQSGSYVCKNNAVTGTSYTFTGLTNGTKYTFKVKAYVGGAWKEASDAVTGTPVGAGIPQNIKTTAGDSKVTMTWSAVTGATKYAVYMLENGSYVCKSNAVTGTSYTFTGLTNGTAYSFKVKAYVNGAWKTASGAVSGTPVSSGIPQNIKTTAGNGKVTMTWSAVTGATKYAVYMLENGSYVCKSNAVTGTSYTFTGLTNGTAYSFKVKAYVNGAWKTASGAVSGTPKA